MTEILFAAPPAEVAVCLKHGNFGARSRHWYKGRRGQIVMGTRMGRLTMLTPCFANPRGEWYWLVSCDCGAQKVVKRTKLMQGRLKSCGCNQNPKGVSTWVNRLPVRYPRSAFASTYRSWTSMWSRCRGDEHYVGMISACERWRSFDNFLDDMGERPEGTSLDRYPDPYGDYEPGNCRWATSKQQGECKRPWGTVRPKRFPKNVK